PARGRYVYGAHWHHPDPGAHPLPDCHAAAHRPGSPGDYDRRHPGNRHGDSSHRAKPIRDGRYNEVEYRTGGARSISLAHTFAQLPHACSLRTRHFTVATSGFGLIRSMFWWGGDHSPPLSSPIRTPTTAKPTPLWVGALWMLACLISFIAMALASRELAQSMSIMQVLLLRSAVGILIMLAVARHVLPQLRNGAHLWLHALRNLVHFSAQYCWTVAVVLLPLAYVFALEFTMPIWVSLFAALWLGERITRVRFFAMLVSFAGVLVVLRPDTGLEPAALLVLVAAAGYGASAVFVKRLTHTCSPSAIVMWMVLMQCPMAAVMLWLTDDWIWPSLLDTPWVLVLGAATLSAHYTMARALQIMDASLAIPIDFLRVPLVAVKIGRAHV